MAQSANLYRAKTYGRTVRNCSMIAVIVANLITLDGRSDWLEGALLLATYLILAAAFYFLPIAV